MTGCTDRPSDTAGIGDSEAHDRQTAFRVRSDLDAGLNDNDGWSGGVNEDVTVDVESPFRIRFEVESDTAAVGNRSFGLQYRRNGGEWTNVDAQRFPKPEFVRELGLSHADSSAWDVVEGDPSSVTIGSDREDRVLRAAAGGEPIVGIYRSRPRWEPAVVAAEVRLPDGSDGGAGVVFGRDGTGAYYRVVARPDNTVRLSRIADGEKTTVAQKAVAVPTGQWHEIEVEIEGSAISIELGDNEFKVVEDDHVEMWAPGYYVAPGQEAAFRSVVIEGIPRTPRTNVVSTTAYPHGTETTDLIDGSTSRYGGGAGVRLAETTPTLAAGGVQSEWEWPLVIRRFADGAVTNDDGDTFEFRMVYAGGDPIAVENHPELTVSVPPRLLGGTFPETPARLGPYQVENADLYFPMEPAETYNVLMMVKSGGGGDRWREVDGANRPATGDLEGLAAEYADGTVHLLHQTSEEVLHHAFRTSAHGTDPDTWSIRDDTVAAPPEPPTQVASLTARSDGSLVAVYGGPEKIRYKIRSPDGTWGEETVVDAEEAGGILSGPMTVLGSEGVVHLAYTEIGDDNGTVWYRRIRQDGSLTPRSKMSSKIGTDVGSRGAILPLAHVAQSNTTVVVYRRDDGTLWARRVAGDGSITEASQVTSRAVVRNAVDSDQAGADAIAIDGTVHVLFIGREDGSIYHTQSTQAGTWTEPSLQVDGITGQWIRGQPVRSTGSDTTSAYGYVYDAGSNGGAGMNWYGEIPLGGQESTE